MRLFKILKLLYMSWIQNWRRETLRRQRFLSCVNTSQIACLDDIQVSFFAEASLVGQCYENCPIECEQIKYDLTVSASTFTTEWYAKVLTRNADFNRVINKYFDVVNIPEINYNNDYASLKNSVARVNVFYEDLRYTVVDESPAITTVSLLGTIGGNVGLFLGKLEILFRFK